MKRSDIKALLEFYRTSDKECELVRKLETDQERQRRELERVQAVKTELLDAINNLPYEQRCIVVSKYVNGWKWARIEARYPFSDRTARNIGNKGLDRMATLLKDSAVIRDYLRRRR